MLKKVMSGRFKILTCLKDLPALLVLILISLTAGFAQDTKPKEFINKKDGLRYQVINKDTVLSMDKPPVFPGGEAAMIKYLQKKIVYPEVSRKNGKEGLVKAKFVVTKTGEVSDIAIFEGLDPHIDSLVVKIIKDMPAWQPALQGQTPLAIRYNLPVRFTLLSESGRKNIREYNADGISFQHLKKWEINRAEKEGAVELKLEQKGLGKGGLIYVNIEKDTMNARLHLDKKAGSLYPEQRYQPLTLYFQGSGKKYFQQIPGLESLRPHPDECSWNLPGWEISDRCVYL